MSTSMTQTDNKYFKAECQKCGVLLVVPVKDSNEWNYYLCQTCAFSKVGAQWQNNSAKTVTHQQMNLNQSFINSETMNLGVQIATTKTKDDYDNATTKLCPTNR